MKYCSECGNKVTKTIPEGDDRLRYVCSNCQIIHYQNPRMVVGIIPVRQNKVLLCRRAIEPRKGFWTVPAGFMENGETILQGAIRETWEEARAKVSNEELYRLFDLPYIHQVYIFYRARLDNDDYQAGPESLEVALFAEQDIPWDEIAFPVVSVALQELFADSRAGHFPVRITELDPMWHDKK
jgi:ADP-ribose pyrophosphatase YjhB (NUDIX family)